MFLRALAVKAVFGGEAAGNGRGGAGDHERDLRFRTGRYADGERAYAPDRDVMGGVQRLRQRLPGSYLHFRPLLTGLFAALLPHEAIGVFEVAGGCMIVAGTYMAAR